MENDIPRNMNTSSAATLLDALGNKIRLDFLCLLAQAEDGGLSLGIAAERLGLPITTLSFHIAALESQNAIRAERRGRFVCYTINSAVLGAAIDFLTVELGLASTLKAGLQPSLALSRRGKTAAVQPFNILFLCRSNDGLSMIAECILNEVGHGMFRAFSAGLAPAAAPRPIMVTKLRALGHDVTSLACKSWRDLALPEAPVMDFVIWLDETIDPWITAQFPGRPVMANWPLGGQWADALSDDAETTSLNALYGRLHSRIGIFVSLPLASLDKATRKHELEAIGTEG
jgi:arsenate reductase